MTALSVGKVSGRTASSTNTFAGRKCLTGRQLCGIVVLRLPMEPWVGNWAGTNPDFCRLRDDFQEKR